VRVRRHSGGSEEVHIDLAPMLDFFLNLLIFFIISAAFVTETGIQVSRPSAHTAVVLDNANILVAISAKGEVFINRQHSDIRLLRGAIETLRRQHPKAAVVIEADKEARAGLMVEAMDQARLAGVSDVSLAASREP
jgi:biopolymer transport protein ExbD